jgi:hypothetical protein
MQKIIRQREGWKKPPEGKLLINVDGSFRVEKSSGGAGVVIRDSNGLFIAGSYICIFRAHNRRPSSGGNATRERSAIGSA